MAFRGEGFGLFMIISWHSSPTTIQRKRLNSRISWTTLKWWSFLVDIIDHLNTLNLKLQGKKHTICGLLSDINSFQRNWIEIFIDDIADGKLFFPTLKKYEEDQPNAKVSHASFLDTLKVNFEARFEDFKLDRIVLAGLVDPFGIKNPLDFGTKRNLFLSGLTLQQLLQRLLTCRRISADQTDRLQILLSFGRRLRLWQQRRSLQQPSSVCLAVLTCVNLDFPKWTL